VQGGVSPVASALRDSGVACGSRWPLGNTESRSPPSFRARQISLWREIPYTEPDSQDRLQVVVSGQRLLAAHNAGQLPDAAGREGRWRTSPTWSLTTTL